MPANDYARGCACERCRRYADRGQPRVDSLLDDMNRPVIDERTYGRTRR